MLMLQKNLETYRHDLVTSCSISWFDKRVGNQIVFPLPEKNYFFFKSVIKNNIRTQKSPKTRICQVAMNLANPHISYLGILALAV